MKFSSVLHAYHRGIVWYNSGTRTASQNLQHIFMGAGVNQLVTFNKRLADLSPPGQQPRLIDGVLVTKFDAIDDKVGAVLSMAYSSGAPIMFVGCGQTYVDLKRLDTQAVVKSLLK